LTNPASGCGLTTRSTLEFYVKVDGREDKVDMGANVLREMISFASDVLLSGNMSVNIILGVHEPFCFFDRNIDVNPTLGGTYADALAR
jgi:hypothetical protein